VTDGLALAVALAVLALALGVAVSRPPYLSESLAASAGAVLLVIVGAIGLSAAGAAVRALAPTVGFLAAMLLIADGCRRAGLFDAMGVNVGPNLTYVGSLATLLWRRVLHAEDTDVDLGEFLRLGALTVPAGLVAATVLLWLALQA
jgi:arsenical pump membrane protein